MDDGTPKRLILDRPSTAGMPPPPELGVLAAEADVLCEELLAGAATPSRVAARVRAASERLGLAAELVGSDLYALLARHPRFLTGDPAAAIAAQLKGLRLFAPVRHASLWVRHGRTAECAGRVGERLPIPALRQAAVDGGDRGMGGGDGRLEGLCTLPAGEEAALVVRAGPRRARLGLLYARETARALEPLVERRRHLGAAAAGEQLLQASERRIARLGFDIHDRPLQAVAVLLGELPGLQRELAALVPDDDRRRPVERRIESLEAALRQVEGELRGLAVSAGGPAAGRSLLAALEKEVGQLAGRSPIRAHLRIEGDVERATASQRIAVARIVEEALANVRDHSRASRVHVSVRRRRDSLTVRIVDNGCGFDPTQAERRAIRDHGLGLAAMRERARLLGGFLRIRSRPGGPTVVSALRPAWDAQPAAPRPSMGAARGLVLRER